MLRIDDVSDTVNHAHHSVARLQSSGWELLPFEARIGPLLTYRGKPMVIVGYAYTRAQTAW